MTSARMIRTRMICTRMICIRLTAFDDKCSGARDWKDGSLNTPSTKVTKITSTEEERQKEKGKEWIQKAWERSSTLGNPDSQSEQAQKNTNKMQKHKKERKRRARSRKREKEAKPKEEKRGERRDRIDTLMIKKKKRTSPTSLFHLPREERKPSCGQLHGQGGEGIQDKRDALLFNDFIRRQLGSRNRRRRTGSTFLSQNNIKLGLIYSVVLGFPPFFQKIECNFSKNAALFFQKTQTIFSKRD
ncbi:hypothetical protein BD770DRAFT_432717 [Pilaira anomala]|nr:hypothetical protein BD770DRAFT_432717 [Pilaira anomala]